MERLSSPFSDFGRHYEIVVVGSGYGGAIAAARLASAGREVCLLERGREIRPGDYPKTADALLRELQLTTDGPAGGHLGPETGLYDLRFNDEINVLLGCGLGGTSLVNANVCLWPDARVFEDPLWPGALRDDPGSLLEGLRRALEMLAPAAYPMHGPQPRKLTAMAAIARALDAPLLLPPIAVTFEDGVSRGGVPQAACNGCGDCVSGCNYRAKNTLLMNYLPDARRRGASIFTEVQVRHVERDQDRWIVHLRPLGAGAGYVDPGTCFVSADIVILAAGALGSTEILLRSRRWGLPLSPMLGKRLTGNGDVLAFSYNTAEPVNAVGLGPLSPDEHEAPGPCITSCIPVRGAGALDDGILLEEGVIPGPLAPFLPLGFTAAPVLGVPSRNSPRELMRKARRVAEGLIGGAHRGAVHHTHTFLAIGHDHADGAMNLDRDRLRIAWPALREQPVFQTINDALGRASAALGGTLVKDPLWRRDQSLITVHPLGGCAMAESAAVGVVDHRGRVFRGEDGAEVHEGLYVWDGAIVPRSPGANPLLVICALAERACALLSQERGWSIDYLPSAAPPAIARGPGDGGVQFTERLHGHVSTTVRDDAVRGARVGQEHGSELEFTVTITAESLGALLRSERPASIVGRALAPAIADGPLTITRGDFYLLLPDGPDARRMTYEMTMKSVAGREYLLRGVKHLRDDPGFDAWADATTLFTTIHDGPGGADPVLATGVVRLGANDLRRLLSSVRAINLPPGVTALAVMSRFGAAFAGALFEIYGPRAKAAR